MSYLKKLIVGLILLVPVSIGALNPTAEIVAVLAFLLSIVVLPFVLREWPTIPGAAKKLIMLLAGYFSIGFIGLFLNGFGNSETYHALGTTAHFIIIIPILIVLLVEGVEERWFWYAVIAGAIFNGAYSLFFEQRGSINAVLYGGISIFLGFSSLMAWRYISPSLLGRGLVLLGYMLGLLASFYSTTRGSWVAIPGLLAVFGLYLYLMIPSNKKRFQAFVSVILLLGVVAGFSYEKISGKIVRAMGEVANYNDTGAYRSSVGYRLEVYKGAVEVIKRNPILGVGLGSEMEAVNALTKEGYINDISYLVNVHNQILQEGVSKGVVGILSYFFLMGYLLYFFLRGMIKSSQYREIHAVGVLIVIGYGVFGLTNITFTHGVFNTFFVSMLALMFGVKGLLLDVDSEFSKVEP